MLTLLKLRIYSTHNSQVRLHLVYTVFHFENKMEQIARTVKSYGAIWFAFHWFLFCCKWSWGFYTSCLIYQYNGFEHFNKYFIIHINWINNWFNTRESTLVSSQTQTQCIRDETWCMFIQLHKRCRATN